MDNVTYLLGAGASYGAVPIVTEINDRLKIYCKSLEIIDENEELTGAIDREKIEKLKRGFSALDPDNKNYLNKFKEDFSRFYKESKEEYSVDSVARRLQLTNKTTELKKFKFMLSAFITLEQFINGIDIRYRKWFDTVLGQSPEHLPKNISVISWNYDYQFEMAYDQYYDSKRYSELSSSLNVISKGIPAKNNDSFKIIKINGTAGTKINEDKISFLLKEKKSEFDITSVINYILFAYRVFILGTMNFEGKAESNLSFAWEKNQSSGYDDIIKLAQAEIRNSKHIVIIGYSFPTFNAPTDSLLFNSSGVEHTSKKYYIQDYSEKNARSVEEKLRELTKVGDRLKVSISTNVDEFLIPFSYFV